MTLPLPTRAQRVVSLACLVTVVTALCVTTAVGTAAAGDQTAIVWSEPETVAAEPGETVELEVGLQSDGSHEAGVEAVTLVAQYHPDYLSVVDVERGPWLEGDGDDVDVRTAETIADENGTALLEQRRDPAAGGVRGVGTIATVTVEIAEDAPAATTELSFDATDVSLTSEWPTPVVDEPTTIEIDGGGERVSPDEFDHPDPDDVARDLEATAGANSTAGDGEGDGNGDENESTGSGPAETTDATESIPGFTVAGTVGISAALVVAGALAARRNRSRR